MTSITETTIRAGGIVYPVLSDSGVYQQDEGYERVLIINNWNPVPGRHRQMAKFHVRVDRVPGASFANTHVWSSVDSSWQLVAMLDHRDFWESMPGYLRWFNDRSDEETARMLSEMVSDLITLVEEKEVRL